MSKAEEKKPVIDPDKPAIILVHGIFDKAKAMSFYAKKAESQGYEAHAINFLPRNATISIDEMALQLKGFIEDKIGPERKFHLVGHSMGGIVIRCYLQRYANLELALSATTLGSPHQGTHIAQLLTGRGVLDMRRGSALIQTLQHDDEKIRHLPLLSIWTPTDLVILPSHSSEWAIADNRKRWMLGHVSHKYSSKIIQEVFDFISEAEKK